MIKTEVFVSYQWPSRKLPYAIITIKDSYHDGRELTSVIKITRDGCEQYREEVTSNGNPLSDDHSNTREILEKYGSHIGSRIIGHL